MLFIWCSIFVFFMHISDSCGNVRVALLDLEKKQVDQALKNLENIEKNNDEFVDSQKVLLREYYRDKKWDKYFAGMMYYWLFFKQFNEVKYFDQRFLLLRPLSFLKLCQFDRAQNDIDDIKAFATKLKIPYVDELQLVQELLKSYLKLKNLDVIENKSFDRIPLLGSNSYWSVKNKNILLLKNAKNLRVKMESLCQK